MAYRTCLKYYKQPSYRRYMPRGIKCVGCPYRIWCVFLNQPLCLKKG